MRNLLIIAIFGLVCLSAYGLSHKKSSKFLGVRDGDIVEDTNLNANVDPDFIANVGFNGLGNIEKEDEKSASWSGAYSKEKHHDSQKIDISINFNVGVSDSSDSDEELELLYAPVVTNVKKTVGTGGDLNVGSVVKEVNVGSLVNDVATNLRTDDFNVAPIVKEVNVAPRTNDVVTPASEAKGNTANIDLNDLLNTLGKQLTETQEVQQPQADTKTPITQIITESPVTQQQTTEPPVAKEETEIPLTQDMIEALTVGDNADTAAQDMMEALAVGDNADTIPAQHMAETADDHHNKAQEITDAPEVKDMIEAAIAQILPGATANEMITGAPADEATPDSQEMTEAPAAEHYAEAPLAQDTDEAHEA